MGKRDRLDGSDKVEGSSGTSEGGVAAVRARRYLVGISAVVLVLMSVSAQLRITAFASHSVPTPYKWFWDCNNDAFPDDGCALFVPAGLNWTQAKLDRINAAFYHWRFMTDFDPYTNNNATNHIYIDRQVDHAGCPGAPSWQPIGDEVVIARVCVIRTWNPDPPNGQPAYYRLHNADTFFNYLIPWWFGAGAPPSESLHFQGVLTHEMGHWVLLEDLGCTPGYTMCGGMSPTGSYSARTLETDDVTAASFYP